MDYNHLVRHIFSRRSQGNISRDKTRFNLVPDESNSPEAKRRKHDESKSCVVSWPAGEEDGTISLSY